MILNVIAENAIDFTKLDAAFYVLKIEKGLTKSQLQRLMDRLHATEEYELITIEGQTATAMGLLDIRWFEEQFEYDPDPIEEFVKSVVDGEYDTSEDAIYYLNDSPIFIASPEVY